MTDKRAIFESDEEYIKFYKDTNNNNNPSLKEINAVKQAGYIRRNPVEEAEEMYNNYKNGINCLTRTDIMEKQHEAIQYLKKIIQSSEVRNERD